MKTAISLPDDLFEDAENLARKLGVTRSRLIALALTEYVARNRSARVTERLDVVYGAEDSRLDPITRKAQRRTLQRNDW